MNNNLGVTLSDYQALSGFGDAGADQELFKAIQAGQITGRDTTGLSLTQEPLKTESLEQVLKSLEFRLKDIQLWNAVPKMAAYNTVEEFLQLESFGTDRGGFYNEGELSDVEDSSYIRRAAIVKYIQVTGEVTMQAQMVRSFVDAMRQEVENKTMWVMRKADSALTKGDSSIIPQEWDGFYAQHASIGNVNQGYLYNDVDAYHQANVVYDLRGASLTQEHLEDIAIIIDDNYGDVDTIFGPPSVLSGLSKDYFERQRIMLNASQEGSYKGVIGTIPKAIATTIGDIALRTDKFMKRDATKKLTATATSTKAPNAPVAVPDAVALTGADVKSKFGADENGDDVYYAVSALNRYGESALTLLESSAITLATGQSVDLRFTSGGGAIPATGYVIYRTKDTASSDPSADGENFYPLFKVSAASLSNGYDGGAAGRVRDRNRFLPDTEQAFVLGNNTDVWSFKQLAPISKLDLAVLSMSKRFITYLFGTPQLYVPKKSVRIINIGPYTAS